MHLRRDAIFSKFTNTHIQDSITKREREREREREKYTWKDTLYNCKFKKKSNNKG